jgi:hypothetical protein
MTPAFVTGLGLWAPGLPGPNARAEAAGGAASSEPPATLLPPALARRASLLTRMLVEVAAQAGRAAGVDLGVVPTVFSTAYGEIETLHVLLEMLYAGEGLSPTRFHSSVYNTASGYFSIAAANRSPTTTVAAGEETVAMALLEGHCLLQDRGPSVVVCFADEASTIPFLREAETRSLAAAVTLSAQRPAGPCFGRLGVPRRGRAGAVPSSDPSFSSNPIAPVLPLLRALQAGETGALPLSLEAGEGWLVDLLPA